MCWYCCISLRGAVYFGTSVHIFVGLVLLVRWVVLTYLAAFVTQKLLSDTSALILTVLSGLYAILFIILGTLIFAATERQSVSLLKWSSAGFTILQLIVFAVILMLYLFAPGGWTFLETLDELSEEMQLLTVAMYFCCLVATLNYILVLFLYLRKLWNKRQGANNGSRGTTSSLTNIRISHPIPHQTATLTNDSSVLNSNPKYGRRAMIQGPESPGIYESLETHSHSGAHHPFYPANFYSGYSGSRLPQNHHGHGHGHGHQQGAEGIYNGSASIRSGSSIYYHQRGGSNYPYPHQRYREPLTATTASIARANDGSESPGQDWMGAYGTRLQVFQRGQAERASGTTEPLLRQQQTNY